MKGRLHEYSTSVVNTLYLFHFIGIGCWGRTEGVACSERSSRHYDGISCGNSTPLPTDSQLDSCREKFYHHLSTANRFAEFAYKKINDFFYDMYIVYIYIYIYSFSLFSCNTNMKLIIFAWWWRITKTVQQFGVRNCILVLKHICLCYLHKILVKAKILGLDKKKTTKVCNIRWKW